MVLLSAKFFIAVALGSFRFKITGLIKAVLPFSFNRYWYFSTYILIYIFYPYINRMLDTLSQKQHQGICLISLLLFSCLYTFTNREWIVGKNGLLIFVSMYMVGAYIKKYGIVLSKNKCLILVGSCLILSILSTICMKVVGSALHSDSIITYFVWGTEKMLPVATSIFLFLSFENIKVSNNSVRKAIAFISPNLFGVYLLHIGDLHKWLFQGIFNNENTYLNGFSLLLQILLAMIFIFIAGIVIDKIRIRVIEKSYMKSLDKVIIMLDAKTSDYYPNLP